jgi:hypothetical protein
MDITLEQLQQAIRHCTPGAPDSYAGRIWAALEASRERIQASAPGEPCRCDALNEYP